jgi:hypothetical protein
MAIASAFARVGRTAEISLIRISREMVRVNRATLKLNPRHPGKLPLRLAPVAMRKKLVPASGRLHRSSAGRQPLLRTRLMMSPSLKKRRVVQGVHAPQVLRMMALKGN